MHVSTITPAQACAAVLAGSPALGRPFDDHRVGILQRVTALLSGLFYAPAAGRLVIDDPNLIDGSDGMWTRLAVSHAIRRAHGDEYGEAVTVGKGTGRRDKRSGLVVPTGATTVIRADQWTTYSPSIVTGTKTIVARGDAFRSGIVQGMLRPALRDELLVTNAAGATVRATIPGGDVASTFIPKHGALGDSVVLVTAYRLDPAVTA